MLFKEIEGNKEIKNQLISSVLNNRVSHSQLFLGGKGSAKLAIAIAFAQFINCTTKNENDSCGNCDSCVKYNSLTHPDLYLIFPVLTINGIKKPISDNFIFQWREEILKNPYLNLYDWFNVFSEDNKTGKNGLIYTHEAENLQSKLALKHYESEYRVVIMWMPENMQAKTSNKLLKLLEEPPNKTIFLLVSENSEQLLNTVLSRLQITKITNFSDENIKNYILKQNNISSKKANTLISYSEGDLGKALRLLEEEDLYDNHFEEFQSWMRICYSANIKELTNWTAQRAKKGRQSQSVFLNYSLKMIRNCLILNFSTQETLNLDEKENDFLRKFHPFIHEKNIVNISEKIEECSRNIERNANTKIIFYELSLQMMKLLKVNRKFVEIK